MITRNRKLVALAMQQNREISDRLLHLPRYETTKCSLKSEMIRYSAMLKDTDFRYKIASKDLNPNENLAPIIELKEHDLKNSLSEIKSQSVNHENLMLKTVPQPKLQELDTDDVGLSDGEKSQELSKNNDMTVVDCYIEPPPLYYFTESNDDSRCSVEIKSQPEIHFKQKIFETVKTSAVNDSHDDEEESDPFATSGSESYIPSTSEVSDTSSDSSQVSIKDSWTDAQLSRTTQDAKSNKKRRKLCTRPFNDTVRKESSSSSSEENTVKISCSSKRDGKRIRNKRYCCYVCQKVVINLSRHLTSVHFNDTAVARILALPKGSKRRREEFGKLMREGNFYHNSEVLQLKQGELILLRRPTPLEEKKYTYIDYGPCPDCLGFMLKKNISYHMKNNCNVKSQVSLETRKPIGESNAIIAGMIGTSFTSDFTTNILIRMRDDEITKICREDELILKFGFMLYEKYSTTQCELIRQSMRQIGRFFKEVNKARPDIKSLSNSLQPQYFDVVVQATKTLCVTNINFAKRTEFQIPSLALKIGHALKKCISYERGNALRSGDVKRNRELESFLSLMDMEWSIRISSNALNTLHVRKSNCTQLLPITSDLIKLNNYLETEIKKYKTEIEKTYQPSTSCWSRFATVLLSKIVVFNKRRSGETSRMTLEQYSMRPLWSEQTTEESRSALTQFERQLAEHFVVVEVPGKRGRRVPILLSPDMKHGIDLLIKTRTLVGISIDNSYIFARSGKSLEYLRGHDCLRRCCGYAQLESPENINDTKLRKYIATVTQIINLTENETDWLARHLGHDVAMMIATSTDYMKVLSN